MATVMKVHPTGLRGSRSTSRGAENRGKAASSAEKYKVGLTTLAQSGKGQNFERIDEEEDKNDHPAGDATYDDMGSAGEEEKGVKNGAKGD
jgi:hypothetical protein